MRFSVALVVLVGFTNNVVADPIRVGGVGAATKLLPILFAEFDSQEKLQVIPSLGSSGGLRALAENAINIAVAGRPLNAEEIKLGMTVGATVRTPFVLVTSHPKPNGLKRAEVADIYKTPNPAWIDGSPIRVILRPKSDSDTPVLIASFPGMSAALDAARARHDVLTAATDQDSADSAERLQGSLAGSTLTQITTEQRNLRLIAIDGVAPSLEALEIGTYPIGKTLHFVLPAQKHPVAERFLAFLLSPPGQAILRKTGNLVVSSPSGS